jgi:beta-phosphoglucomutase-like phosphatase (HAD superfamily)
MTLFRAVAWDIDGTLIDSEPLHQRALVAASAALGAGLSDLEPEAFRGVHARDIWKALMARFSAGTNFETWVAAIEGYYVVHADELEPNPGAVEAMRELAARGVAQACVSNSGRTIVDANIRALGVGGIITFSLSLDDVSSGKPDPEPFREAARRLGAGGRPVRRRLRAFWGGLRRRRPVDRASRRSPGAVRGLTAPRGTRRRRATPRVHGAQEIVIA